VYGKPKKEYFMKLKGSKTEANLLAAFAGESMARNRYTYYAAKAKKAGQEQIAENFLLTAEQEKEHAKLWFKHLHESFDDTAENLADAAAGEHEEWTQMYKQFAEVAEAEGFKDIAAQFRAVGEIERTHENRFNCFLNNVKTDKVFARDAEAEWACRNCGHIHKGKAAPNMCAVCHHPKAYFETVGGCC